MASILSQLFSLLLTCLGGGNKQDQGPQQGQSQQQQPWQGQQQQQPWQGQGQPQPHGQQPSQQYPPQHQQQPQYPSHHNGSPGPQKPHRPVYSGGEDANQHNQQNPHYLDLRERARKEGDQMAQCFDASHRIYESGDGAKAKDLSNEGKHHKSEMERLNDEASKWIFAANNTDSAPDELDLHGLFVAEAIQHTEKAIGEAQRRGDDHIKIIVGKGLHSQGHVAKLKPAIENLMQKYQLAANLDPHNEGVLFVSLGGPRGGDRGLGADDITRRLDKNDESCIVM